jgi:hypothetical protein
VTVKSDPAVAFAAVTKSDTTNLGAVRAFYIGGVGDVALKANAFTPAVTFSAVPAGTLLPVSAQIVMSTGTTATLIIALY